MQRAPHIPVMPKGFIAVRILQLVFALIVLGLLAFLISNTVGFYFSVRACSTLINKRNIQLTEEPLRPMHLVW